MPTISLTLPVAGTTVTAGLHSANYSALQTLLNGGLDTSNWASGKIFAPSKLLQEGATDGQFLKWVNASSQWQPAAGSATPGYATTLPGSPSDGQESILVDSLTVPTYQWLFRFNNGSSNTDKWEFIGGTPALVEVTTDETTASVTYAALTTAGPSFTIPRGGIYQVGIGFQGGNTGTNNSILSMSYDIGGTGAVTADEAVYTMGNTTNLGSVFAERPKTIAAATALVSKYKTSAGTAHFSRRFMRITPVRVS